MSGHEIRPDDGTAMMCESPDWCKCEGSMDSVRVSVRGYHFQVTQSTRYVL
jgi:hypothetical protein